MTGAVGITASATAGTAVTAVPSAVTRLLTPVPRPAPPLPHLTAADLGRLLNDAGLIGHGGAGFPTARKLAALTSRSVAPVVVANGSEGEQASSKDAVLLGARPDLVLDGLAVLAAAVGASETHLVVADPHQASQLADLAAVRGVRGRDLRPPEVSLVPDAFLSGEETAVVRWLGGGPSAPTVKRPMLVHRGLHGRPTLVQNVETLAQIAVLAHEGAARYRALGTADEPGTRLFSVSGAVHRPGVVEAPGGIAVLDLLDLAGGAVHPLSAVLIGGYAGGWVSASELPGLPMTRGRLAALGSSLGAGVVVALPNEACGLGETARVLRMLAEAGAAQCGPCLNGLPRLAEDFASLAYGPADPGTVAELYRVAALVEGRGACHHPDGTVRFLRSALRVFSHEVGQHLAGRCTATATAPVLPL